MLILDSACTSSALLKMIYFTLEVLKYVFIIIPIGLIIMLSIDLLKNVMATDQEEVNKNNKTAIRRVMMCIALFLVPTFSRIAFSLIDSTNIGETYTACIAQANIEGIRDTEEQEEIAKEELEQSLKEALAKKNTIKDPISDKRIVEKGNKNQKVVDKKEQEQEKATNASAQAFLESLQKMSKTAKEDRKRDKPWRYSKHWGSQSKSFASAVKNGNRRLSCVRLVSWALIDIGVLKSGQFIQTYANGHGPRGNGASSRAKKYLKFKKMGSKRQNTLIKNGSLEPGDIIIYKYNHINVYAGNGKFYDGGHVSCASGASNAIFKSFGPVKHGNNIIYGVYRFK